jgi:hypothetical protein
MEEVAPDVGPGVGPDSIGPGVKPGMGLGVGWCVCGGTGVGGMWLMWFRMWDQG